MGGRWVRDVVSGLVSGVGVKMLGSRPPRILAMETTARVLSGFRRCWRARVLRTDS